MSIDLREKQDDQQQICSDQEQDKEEKKPTNIQPITYGESSLSMKCPYCLQHIQSEIILKPEFISIALGMSIFVIVPHLTMMLVIIFLLHFTASRKHRCPLCERELGSNGKFLMYLTDEVYSISIFSAGFIFTKKMVVTVLLLGFTFFVLTLRVANLNRQRWVTTTWVEYLQQCGNGSSNECLSKYKGKQFMNWQGHLLKLQDNRQNPNKWYMHALSLYLKMDPKVTNDQKPDVLLTFSSEAVYYNTDVLKNVKHGDLIQFNCTLHDRQRGGLKDLMHFHIDSIQIIGHNPAYALFTDQIEEQWIRIHVEDKKLRTEPSQQQKTKNK